MSVEPSDDPGTPIPAAAALLARVEAATRRADAHLSAAIDDFFLAEDGRLDDRVRAALGVMLTSAVASVAREVGGYAGRLLGHAAPPGKPVDEDALLARLIASGLLRDRGLMAEILGQVRQDLIGVALVANRAPGTHVILIPRLIEGGDGVVATAATAYLLAENRRRDPHERRQVKLPTKLHHRLVWWIAAALRPPAGDAATDRALVAAAQRSLSAHDEQDRLEAVALRLAAAIDPEPADLPALLAEALEDGRAALFIALLARASSIAYDDARALAFDSDGERLWLALRAIGLDRGEIARIGFALCEADDRRDVEAFADALDLIAAVPVEVARDATAALSLHPEYRNALRALETGTGR